MPRKLINALTPLAVKNAKPGRHADGGGLHLLVKETGGKQTPWESTSLVGDFYFAGPPGKHGDRGPGGIRQAPDPARLHGDRRARGHRLRP